VRVLERYLLKSFLIAFVLTLSVFTFVMCLGAVVRAIDLLARGVSGLFILKVFFYNIPFLLTFSIPMSVLTTVLLLFGRLSSDNEISAMKASGLSLWQITTPVVLASVVLSVVCLVINGSLAPASHWAQRRVLVELGITDPLSLIEEGRFTRDIPGWLIYVGKKERAQATDVHIYELGEGGVKRSIRAKSGTFVVDKEARKMLVTLYDARAEEPDPNNPNNLTQMKGGSGRMVEMPIDLKDILQRGNVTKKAPDMTYAEVLDAIRDVRGAYPGVKEEDLDLMRMKLVVDANQRLAMAVSCFAFTLLGIPLGMKSHRKETSVGFGISILVVFFFYFFIIIADSLVKHPEFRPDLIIWIPVIACQLIGAWLLKRMA
jgi:lipopolysaccharide export system permease protein